MTLCPPVSPPKHARHYVKFHRLAWLNAVLSLRFNLFPDARRVPCPTAGLYPAFSKCLSPPRHSTSYDVCPFQRARRQTFIR